VRSAKPTGWSGAASAAPLLLVATLKASLERVIPRGRPQVSGPLGFNSADSTVVTRPTTRNRRVRARLLVATFAVTAVAFPLGAQAAAGGRSAAARTDGLCELLDLVLRLDCGQSPPPADGPPPGAAQPPPGAAQPDRVGATEPDRVRRTSTDIEYDPRRLTVTFNHGTPRRTVEAVLARAEATLEQAVPRIDAYLVGVDPARRDAALESLRSSDDVASADREVIVHALDTTPNDSEWPEQWGLRLTGISQAWQLAPPAERVVVAVIDTGVDATHPDLQGVVVPGYDFVNQTATPLDDEGHGTAVAGVIAARKDNGIGIAGICGGCRIMPVKVLDRNGVGDDAVIAAGIVWAVDHGANVINLSLGGPGSTPALSDGIAYAAAKGVMVVAAAGNSAASVPFYPAADPLVVSVAATTQGDRPYVWSNFGDWVKLAAPGCNPAPMLAGGYGGFCGTSSATPVVTGLVALAVAANPRATAEQIEQALERPAVAMAGFVRFGRIDAPRTLSLLAPAVHAERAATTSLIKGTLTPGAPNRAYVRSTAGGHVTATLTFQGTGRLSLSLTPQQPPGPTTRVAGSGRLTLKRTLHAGTIRFVVRGHRARFELAIVTTQERSDR
jgi:subtilisin family serine protease